MMTQSRISIGVLVPTLDRRDGEMLRGIRAFATPERRWSITVVDFTSHWSLQDWRALAPDGLIAFLGDRSTARRLLSLKRPLVNISTALYPDECSYPRVGTDNRRVGAEAARYFLSLGFTNFAFFDTPGFWWNQERHGGFVTGLQGAGHDCFVFSEFKKLHRSRVNPVHAWVASLPKPAALLAVNDYAGRDLLAHCRDAGIRVPEEVAVLGIDNESLICEVTTPPLSSIATEPKRIGYYAAVMLDRLLQGLEVNPSSVLLEPAGIITRQSTDILPIADPDVALALQLIRSRAMRGLDVAAVVHQIPISRRQFERRFRAAMGHSILHEIHTIRVERAKRLLIDTDMSIPGVAAQSGFTNPQRLNAAFNKMIHMSPGVYREHFRPVAHH